MCPENIHLGHLTRVINLLVSKKEFMDAYIMLYSRISKLYTVDKSYQCSTCSKGFTHRISMKVQERIHTVAKPYQCITCGNGFTQSNHDMS